MRMGLTRLARGVGVNEMSYQSFVEIKGGGGRVGVYWEYFMVYTIHPIMPLTGPLVLYMSCIYHQCIGLTLTNIPSSVVEILIGLLYSPTYPSTASTAATLIV